MSSKLGLIGLGYWGPNYIRTLNNISDCIITWCSDLDESKFSFLKNMNTKTTKDYKEMLSDDSLDAVIVSTPTSTHYSIVKQALEAGKHVLVEKPITTSSKEAEELAELAKAKQLVLMIGHTFLFNAGIKKLKELMTSDSIGEIVYAHSQRTGLGPIRKDVNVLWDLAPHDISIFLHILGMPKRVSAKGRSFIKDGREDVVFLIMEFDNGVIANAHVSWTDPNKIRSLTVVGSKKMVVFNDVSNEHIKVFDKGVSYEPGDSYGEFKDIVREGDVSIPKIDSKEPLRVECEHFLDCIKKRKQPMSDGLNGINVVRVLEAAEKSLKSGDWVGI